MPMFVSNLYDADAAVLVRYDARANDLRKQSRVVNNNGQEQARFNRRRRLAWLFPDAHPLHQIGANVHVAP
jgi:hypothetical protein